MSISLRRIGLKPLIIIGAGGFGREVAWLVERINSLDPTWKLEGFVDDGITGKGASIAGYPILGGIDYFSNYLDKVWVVLAIGSAKTRAVLADKLSRFQCIEFASLIDPSVIMSKRVTVGEGSIICAGSIITVDVRLGKHCIVNLDTTIGHDAVIEDCVTIYPSVNVSGMVRVGHCTELGTGVQIIQGKTIGANSVVGAGAVVVRDIPDSCVAVGMPAKPIKYT